MDLAIKTHTCYILRTADEGRGGGMKEAIVNYSNPKTFILMIVICANFRHIGNVSVDSNHCCSRSV